MNKYWKEERKLRIELRDTPIFTCLEEEEPSENLNLAAHQIGNEVKKILVKEDSKWLYQMLMKGWVKWEWKLSAGFGEMGILHGIHKSSFSEWWGSYSYWNGLILRETEPWLVWLRALSAGLRTEGSRLCSWSGHRLGYGPGPQFRRCRRQPIDVSLPLFLPPTPSL